MAHRWAEKPASGATFRSTRGRDAHTSPMPGRAQARSGDGRGMPPRVVRRAGCRLNGCARHVKGTPMPGKCTKRDEPQRRLLNAGTSRIGNNRRRRYGIGATWTTVAPYGGPYDLRMRGGRSAEENPFTKSDSVKNAARSEDETAYAIGRMENGSVGASLAHRLAVAPRDRAYAGGFPNGSREPRGRVAPVSPWPARRPTCCFRGRHLPLHDAGSVYHYCYNSLQIIAPGGMDVN